MNIKNIDWLKVVSVISGFLAGIGFMYFIYWFYKNVFYLIEKLIDKI